MSVIAFNDVFYYTSFALLAKKSNIFQINNQKYFDKIFDDISLLIESNIGYYGKYYKEESITNKSISDLKEEIQKFRKDDNCLRYLNKFNIEQLIDNLKMFSYNSDGRKEIFEILYNLYNESVHFNKSTIFRVM